MASTAARIDAHFVRLEAALLSALVSLACAPDSDEGDGVTVTTMSVESITAHLDTGETGEPLDSSICFAGMDAVGVLDGSCAEPQVFGYRWATGGCEYVRGCACEGEDCDVLYVDEATCKATYGHCSACDPCPEDMGCTVFCSGTGYLEDIGCGVGCYDPYTRYDSTACNDERAPDDADLYCAGLGRVVFAGHHADLAAASDAGRAWASIAACEAASVASFDQLADRLAALDLPYALVEAARRFAADERRHARLARAIARACGVEHELPTIAEQPVGASLSELVEHTIVAGCIGETLSALELEHMAASCTDPSLAAVIRSIAADEARHAEHAWVVLGHLLARAPELRAAAARWFARPCETIPLGLACPMPVHGLLADSQRAELWALGRRRVVDRLADQLPGSPPPSRARISVDAVCSAP